MPDSVKHLSEKYHQLKTVSFFKRDELTGIKIQNSCAEAELFIQGAHLTHYMVSEKYPLIWCSREAKFQKNSAIRGGIPLCWPWFGDLTKNPDSVQASMALGASSAHGFVRHLDWVLTEISEPSSSETIVKMALSSSDYTQQFFPHAFQLIIEFSISDQLVINFSVVNTSKGSFSYTSALHSYFAIGDITQCSVTGFEDGLYIDALDNWQQKKQMGVVSINGEVDRIYLDAPDRCSIHSTQQNRVIRLETSGSRSTVIWNPWVEKSKRLSDFDNIEYQQMLCIETANALQDFVSLAAGEMSKLTLTVSEL